MVDEIEKGTSEIMDLFLKIMDEGEIRDGRNNLIDFKNTVIIFTTNEGASANRIEQAVKNKFKPEFLSRLNDFIIFNPISAEMSNKITDMELEKLQNKVKDQGTDIVITQDFRDFIQRKTFLVSRSKGARGIQQLINNSIVAPLIEKISSDPVEKYFLDLHDDNLIGYVEKENYSILHSFAVSSKDGLIALKERAYCLKENLSNIVIGQEHAVNAISDAINLRLAKLDDPNKPVAKMLFVGPTGVGKTEMAKAVASEFYGDPSSILTINMPEYTNGFGVSRLIGINGSDEAGLLTSFVQKNPKSVILIDEVEKGTPAIMNLFLKILDEGVIQDARGDVIDFRNTVIIFTSNAGAAENRIEEAIDGYFSPEFKARLHDIVIFNSISQEMSNKIVDFELEQIKQKSCANGKQVEISKEARDFLYKQAFLGNAEKGAREIKSKVANFILKPLSREMLYSAPAKFYFIDIYDGKFVINPRLECLE